MGVKGSLRVRIDQIFARHVVPWPLPKGYRLIECDPVRVAMSSGRSGLVIRFWPVSEELDGAIVQLTRLGSSGRMDQSTDPVCGGLCGGEVIFGNLPDGDYKPSLVYPDSLGG